MLHVVNVGLHDVQPNLRAFMVKGKEGREKGKTTFSNQRCEALPLSLPPYPFSLFIISNSLTALSPPSP
jgi:hypothetical protein